MHADLANPSSPSDLYSHNQPDSPRSFDSCPLGPLPAASTESDRDEDSSSSSSEGTSDAPSAVQSTVSSVSNSAGSPVRTHFHSAENVTLAPQKSGQHLDMEADQRGDFSQHDALISTPVGPSSTGGWELQQDQILSRPGLRRSSSDLSSAAASTSELTTASETTRPTSSQSHSAFSALGPRISFVGPVRPGDRPAPKPFPPPLRASIRNRSRSSSAIAGSVRRISQSASNPSMGFDSGSTSDSGSTPTISASESRPTTLSVSHATTNSEAAERRLAQQDKMDGVVHPHPESKLPRVGRGGRGGAGAADRPTPKRTKRPQTAPAEGSSFSLQSFRSFVSGAKQSLRRRSSQVEEPDETLKRSIGVAESPQADPVELPAPQYLTATRPRAIAQSPASELEEYLRDEHDEYDDGQNDYYDMAGPSRESSSPAFRAYPLPSRSDSGSRGMGNGRHLSNDRREEEEFEDLLERNVGPASDGQDKEMPITSRPHAFGTLGITPQMQHEASTQAEGASPLPLDQNDEARASQARSLTWGGESGSLTSRRGSNLDPPLPGGIFDRRPSRQEIPSGSSSLRSYSVPVGSSRRASTAISEAEGMVCPTPPLAFPPPPRPFYKGTLLLVRDNVVLDDDEKEKEAVVNEDDEASGDEGVKEVSTAEEVSTTRGPADAGAVNSKDDRGEDDTAKGNEIDAHRGISDASTGPDQSEGRNGAQLGSSNDEEPSLTSEAQPVSDSTSQQQKALPVTPKRGKRRPQTAPGGLKSISSDPPQVVITSPDAPPSQLDLSSPSFSSQRRNPGPNQSKAGGTTDSYSPLERVDEHSDETQPSQTVLWSGEAHPHFEVRSGGQLREKVRLKTITGFVRRLFSARSSYDAGVGTVDAVLGKGGVAQLEAADEDENEKGWKRGVRTSRKSRVGTGSAPGKPQSPSAPKPTKQGSKDVGAERPTIIRIVSRDDPLARQRTNSLRNRVGSPGIYSKPNTTRSPSRMSSQTASNPLSPMSLPSSDEVPRYFPNEGSSSPLPLSLQRTRTSDAAVSSPQSEFGARCDTPTSILSTSTSVVRQATGERRDSLARRETPWEDVDSFRRMQKKLQAQQQQQQRPKNVRLGSSVRRPATMERSQDVPSFGSQQSGRDGMTQGVETSTTGSALGVGVGGEKKRVGRRPRTMEGRVEGLAQTQKSAWSGSMEERWGGQGGGETGAEFFL